jgi:hypothetical protein
VGRSRTAGGRSVSWGCERDSGLYTHTRAISQDGGGRESSLSNSVSGLVDLAVWLAVLFAFAMVMSAHAADTSQHPRECRVKKKAKVGKLVNVSCQATFVQSSRSAWGTK